MFFSGKTVPVGGRGRVGVALVRFLAQRGALITVSDIKSAEELRGSLEEISGLAVKLSLGANRIEDIVEAEMVFVSPGVPLDIPSLVAARGRGVAISSATRLFFELCPAPIVGITGTSGKTTTTALVGEMFREAGREVFVGGNIGVPLLDRLSKMGPDSWVVLELSSFQLELVERSPHVAAITNISPNHLDKHRSMTEYVAAKGNIFRYQGAGDYAVLNYDDPPTRKLAWDCPSPVIFFSRREEVGRGALVRDGWVVVRDGGGEVAICPSQDIRLLGGHNLENVLAACALAACCDIQPPAMARAIAGFRGVEHRLELVAEIRGVDYYNDSIATTPERAVAALLAFDRPVVLLAGGRDKHLPLDRLVQVVGERCRGVVLFGEAAARLEEVISIWISHHGAGPSVVRAPSFSQVVELAHRMAQPGDVVLLAPAGSSFDLFANFEERGLEFKRLVGELRDAQG